MYIIFLLLLVAIPSEVLAYVGPGAGITAIGTVIALIGAIILAIIGFVWYPFKRLMNKSKSTKKMKDQDKNKNDKDIELP